VKPNGFKNRTRAIVEMKYFQHTIYSRPVLVHRELVIVPFKDGPRCWINAWRAAGGDGKSEGGGSFSNEMNRRFSDGQTERVYVHGYVRAIPEKESDKQAIAKRIKFIREENSKAKIVVIKTKEIAK